MRKTHRIAALLAVLAAFALCNVPAFAHHGWASYDRSQPLKLTGSVTSVSYGNPHVTVKLVAQGKAWLAVLAPPARMSSRGLPSGAIRIGSTLAVEGYPSRDKDGEMRAERMTLAGTVYELR
ncbi:MAG: DUF6152 family protein [Betaproteobacteria bacterium]